MYRLLWWWSGIVIPHVSVPIGEVVHHLIKLLIHVVAVVNFLLVPCHLLRIELSPLMVLVGLVG